MKLPNFERAVVPEAKIVGYLLHEGHTSCGPKAAFFLRFGFSGAKWEVMAKALQEHAATYEVASTLDTAEGVHYAIEGILQTPDGRNPAIRSVWAIDTGSDTPRLITAYPLKSVRS